MSQSTGGIAAAGAGILVIGGIFGLLLLAGGGQQEDELTASNCSAVVIDAAGLPSDVAGLDVDQATVAATAMTVAAQRQLPLQAVRSIIAAGLVESQLRSLANGGEFVRPATSRVMTAQDWDYWRTVAMLSMNYPNDGVAPGDWDSVGFLQQRPQAGWGGDGSPEEMVQNLLDPAYAAGAYYDRLTSIDGWETMDPGTAAQRVQGSAFPDRYGQRLAEADAIIAALTDSVTGGVGTPMDCSAAVAGNPALVGPEGWTMPVVGSRITGGFGDIRDGYIHAGDDFAVPAGSPIYAAADGIVVHTSCQAWQGRSPCNVQIDHGIDPGTGEHVTTLYVHMYPGNTLVRVGDTVTSGQHIANVGSYGNSTGPHLHLEVWNGDTPLAPIAWLAARGVTP